MSKPQKAPRVRCFLHASKAVVENEVFDIVHLVGSIDVLTFLAKCGIV